MCVCVCVCVCVRERERERESLCPKYLRIKDNLLLNIGNEDIGKVEIKLKLK